MKIDKVPLEIFDGREGDDDFYDDLEIFLSKGIKFHKDIVIKALSWPTEEDIDEKLEKWVEGKSKKWISERTNALRIIYFIAKECVIKRLKEDEIRKELKKLYFSSKFIDFFIIELRKSKKNLADFLSDVIPSCGKLDNLQWRIDVGKYAMTGKKIDEPTAILKMRVDADKEQKQDILLEFTIPELTSLLRTLRLIQEEMLSIKRGIKNV